MRCEGKNLKNKDLEILAEYPKAGVYLIARKDGRQVFVTGLPEYDSEELKSESTGISAGALRLPLLRFISRE
jgi:homoserine O-succinyltransferase